MPLHIEKSYKLCNSPRKWPLVCPREADSQSTVELHAASAPSWECSPTSGRCNTSATNQQPFEYCVVGRTDAHCDTESRFLLPWVQIRISGSGYFCGLAIRLLLREFPQRTQLPGCPLAVDFQEEHPSASCVVANCFWFPCSLHIPSLSVSTAGDWEGITACARRASSKSFLMEPPHTPPGAGKRICLHFSLANPQEQRTSLDLQVLCRFVGCILIGYFDWSLHQLPSQSHGVYIQTCKIQKTSIRPLFATFCFAPAARICHPLAFSNGMYESNPVFRTVQGLE